MFLGPISICGEHKGQPVLVALNTSLSMVRQALIWCHSIGQSQAFDLKVRDRYSPIEKPSFIHIIDIAWLVSSLSN